MSIEEIIEALEDVARTFDDMRKRHRVVGESGTGKVIREAITLLRTHPDAQKDRGEVSDGYHTLAAYEEAMPLERAQELAQAERAGRLVVLPCKVGDFVYDITEVLLT